LEFVIKWNYEIKYLKNSLCIYFRALELNGRVKIGFIVGIAFLAGIAGTLSFSNLGSNSNSTYSQSVGLGANVLVEIVREDGSKETWEGHNELQSWSRNYLVSCITGVDETPDNIGDCVFGADDISIELDEGEGTYLSGYEIGDITLLPEGCSTDDSLNFCTGWTISAVFDFINLNCDEGVDCPILKGVVSGDGSTGWYFNYFAVDPNKEILPNDRVLVQMDFDIPS